jgi:hypothetical protein
VPILSGFVIDAPVLFATPSMELSAHRDAPPMLLVALLVLQAVWDSPPPFSSVTIRSLPSAVVSDWCEMAI